MNVEYPNLEVANPSLCFSGRIMRMERIVGSIFRKHIAPFSLTNSQLSILFVTAKREMVTQNDLTETLFLEKSSVSRNIKRLLENNLIEKVGTRNIQMTTKGKSLLEQVVPEWNKAMEEMNALLGDTGQEAFNTLYKSITKQ